MKTPEAKIEKQESEKYLLEYEAFGQYVKTEGFSLQYICECINGAVHRLTKIRITNLRQPEYATSQIEDLTKEVERLRSNASPSVLAIMEILNRYNAGMSEYFRMHDFRNMYSLYEKLIDEIQGLPTFPRWYSKEEIYHFLKCENYSDQIAEELSQKFSNSLQGAFEKGYEKANRENDRYREALEVTSKLVAFISKSGDGEFRLVVNNRTGYIHPLGKDGETLDFKL